jgi:TonB family protein
MKRACASHALPACRPVLFLCLLALCVSARAQENQKPAQSNNSAPAGNVDYSGTFPPREVTHKARVLSRAVPQYTKSAKQNGIEGTVVIRAIFSKTGEVTGIRVVAGLPFGLTEKAVEAAKKIKFVPAQKDGQVVSQYIQIEYNFSLYDPEEMLRPLEILDQPAPEYTEEARQHHTQGTVALLVAFGPGKRAKVVRVLESLPDGLTEEAKEAAQKIKFEPGLNRQGEPIKIFKRIEYEFKQ